jgi:hypothetical protein
VNLTAINLMEELRKVVMHSKAVFIALAVVLSGDLAAQNGGV